MSETGEVVYGVIGPEHAGEVHTLQRAAFVAEARLYGTVEIPPLVETVDEIRQRTGQHRDDGRVARQPAGGYRSSHPRRVDRLGQPGGGGARPAGPRRRLAPSLDPGVGRPASGAQVPARRWAQERGRPGHERAARLPRGLQARRSGRSGTGGDGQRPRFEGPATTDLARVRGSVAQSRDDLCPGQGRLLDENGDAEPRSTNGSCPWSRPAPRAGRLCPLTWARRRCRHIAHSLG